MKQYCNCKYFDLFGTCIIVQFLIPAYFILGLWLMWTCFLWNKCVLKDILIFMKEFGAIMGTVILIALTLPHDKVHW